ncbi:hypothetical protein BN1708_019719, partial [Verticillium longisporum]
IPTYRQGRHRCHSRRSQK